jgi:predicted DNA-binding transcriptional regulator AlpA
VTTRPRMWEPQRIDPPPDRASTDTPARSVKPLTDHGTDDPPHCYGKAAVCQWLGISVRSWDRAAAAGLTPKPDLIVGSSPRWLASSIRMWLRTRPNLPRRGGKGGPK